MPDLEQMTPEERDEWMRKNPLTQKAMNECTNSAHAFWETKLAPRCCEEEKTCVARYIAPQGIIEFKCPKCEGIIGIFLVAKQLPEDWTIEDS